MPENDDTPNTGEQPPTENPGTENPGTENPGTENPDTEPADQGKPAEAAAGGDAAEPASDRPEAAAGHAVDTDHGEGEQLETRYERTAQGHRVTHRTVRRREVTEDTEEDITDTYPVPYQPPTASGHPSPVG